MMQTCKVKLQNIKQYYSKNHKKFNLGVYIIKCIPNQKSEQVVNRSVI